MPLVPVNQSRTVLLAPQAIGPGNARGLDVKSKIRLAQHVDHVDAQPPREIDVPCTGIGETPNNQAGGVTAILLLNQAVVQAVIV